MTEEEDDEDKGLICAQTKLIQETNQLILLFVCVNRDKKPTKNQQKSDESSFLFFSSKFLDF